MRVTRCRRSRCHQYRIAQNVNWTRPVDLLYATGPPPRIPANGSARRALMRRGRAHPARGTPGTRPALRPNCSTPRRCSVGLSDSRSCDGTRTRPDQKVGGLFRVTPKIQVVSLFRVTASAAVVNHWFHHGLRLSASCHDRARQRLISVRMRSDHGAL